MDNLLLPTWMRTLHELLSLNPKPRSISSISKKTNTTFSHMAGSIIPLLESKGLITAIFEGRERHISLTTKGIRIANMIHLLVLDLENKN